MPFHKISIEVDLIFNLYIYIYITLKKRKLYVTNQIHCCGPCGPVEAYCQNSGRIFFEGIPLVQKLYFFNPSFIVA